VFFDEISDIIYRQQKESDNLYKDAVLSNYSHEQLTPLNNFLNNSDILRKNKLKLKNDLKVFHRDALGVINDELSESMN
jgi:signal transduction histidine kinase